MRERIVGARRHFRRGGVGHDTMWAGVIEAGNLVSSLVGFGVVSSQLGPSRYFPYAVVYTIISAAGSPIPGIILTLLQHTVRDREDMKSVADSCVSLMLGCGVLLAGVMLVLTAVLVKAMPLRAAALLILTETVLLPYVHVVSASIQALDRFPRAARLRLLPISIKILSMLGLLAVRHVTLFSIGATLCAGYCGAVVIAAVVARRQLGFVPRFGRPHLRHLKTTLGYAVAISAIGVQTDGDKQVMSAYAPAALPGAPPTQWSINGGLYSAAYRLVQLGFLPVNRLIAATHVKFLQVDHTEGGSQMRKAARFTTVSVVYGLLFSIGVWFASPLIPLVLGAKWRGSMVMLRYLSPVVAFRAMSMFAMNGLVGIGRAGVRTGLLIFGAALSIGIYVLMIPSMGWRGAVWGTLITELVLAVTTWSALVWFERRGVKRRTGAVGAIDLVA